MEENMSLNAALTHSMTFKGLDPYQVENLCETLYSELERMMNKTHPKFKTMQFNTAEFKQSHILGMRRFYLQQMYAQKVSYDNFCEAERLFSNIPIEMTEDEIKMHKKKFRHVFDELDDEVSKGMHTNANKRGNAMSAAKKKEPVAKAAKA
jgi:hypothetical protein